MRIFSKLVFTIGLFFIFVLNNIAQTKDQFLYKNFELGLEVQAYPTGIIPGIRLEKYLNPSTSVNLRLGYQIINHRDLGIQKNEEGSGYGVSIAFRRFFELHHKGLSLALRTDLWFNKMDWRSETDSGTSNIKVIQPTFMSEYSFGLGSNFSITPSLSFGWEWNVSTDGEPVGEGAIVLLGCTFALRM